MNVVDNQYVKDNKNLVRYLLKKKMGGFHMTPGEFNDVTTDVFVKCIQNMRYHTDEFAMGTFIGLQVRSALAEHFQNTAQSKDDDPLWGSVELTGQHDRAIEEPESDEDAMDYFREKLKPYLPLLAENEQRVMVLHAWKRLGINEIADKMDMRASSISTIKKRAESKLKSYLKSGRKVNLHQEVDTDLPLEHAIKQLPDTLYHAYRLHHLKGWSVTRVAAIMGRSMMEIVAFVEEAKREVAYRWGYRA